MTTNPTPQRFQGDPLNMAEEKTEQAYDTQLTRANAAEARLRLLDSRGEAAKAMLKADRDLIEALERVER